MQYFENIMEIFLRNKWGANILVICISSLTLSTYSFDAYAKRVYKEEPRRRTYYQKDIVSRQRENNAEIYESYRRYIQAYLYVDEIGIEKHLRDIVVSYIFNKYTYDQLLDATKRVKFSKEIEDKIKEEAKCLGLMLTALTTEQSVILCSGEKDYVDVEPPPHVAFCPPEDSKMLIFVYDGTQQVPVCVDYPFIYSN